MEKLKIVLVKPYSDEQFLENLIVKYIDDYISVVWTDRFNKAGEVELIVPVTSENISIYQQGYVLLCDRSKKGMIIESIELTKTSEGSKTMTIKGRSAEALLDRRIAMDTTEVCNVTIKKNKDPEIDDTFDGVLVKELIGPVMIDGYCDDEDRIVENFTATFTELSQTAEPGPFDEMQINSSVKRGTNIYDFIAETCDSYGVGFKVDVNMPDTTLPMPQTALLYNLSFYKSTDRSYAQNDNPFVTFSPNLDNLKDVRFIETSDKFKNVALVLGEMPQNNNEKRQKTAIVYVGEEETREGINRREMVVDATDIDSKTVTKALYPKLLEQRGMESLSSLSRQSLRVFDGTIIIQSQPFEYGVDYNLGDFVQIIDTEFTKSSKVRVEEVVFSDDQNGLIISMSFTVASYIRPSDELPDFLKYVYWYYDKRTYTDMGEVDVIVVTGLRVNEINDDGILNLPIPVQWNNYYIVVELNQTGG